MKVSGIAAAIDACIFTGEQDAGGEVAGIYACDLLSWVMSHARKGDAWITVHTNVNIVAVAVLAEISCIIIPEGIKVEEPTLKRAQAEGIPILGTELTVYEICRRVPQL